MQEALAAIADYYYRRLLNIRLILDLVIANGMRKESTVVKRLLVARELMSELFPVEMPRVT